MLLRNPGESNRKRFGEFFFLRHFQFSAQALPRIPWRETFRFFRRNSGDRTPILVNIFYLRHKLSEFGKLFWGLEYPFINLKINLTCNIYMLGIAKPFWVKVVLGIYVIALYLRSY